MSLKFTLQNTIKISDIKGNKLFKYPIGTVLDNIITDLWNDIVRYLSYPPFIVCNIDQNVPFYCKIGKKEFDNIKKKLRKYHHTNSGIPLFPNYIWSRNSYVGIDKDHILTNGNYYFNGHIHDSKLQMFMVGCVVDNNTKIYCVGNSNNGNISQIMIYDPHY